MIDLKRLFSRAGHGALVIGAVGIIALPSVFAQQPTVRPVEVPATTAAAPEELATENGAPLSEQERTERAQTRALNGSILARLKAVAAANQAAEADYQRQRDAHQQAVAETEAANRAAAEAVKRQAEQEKAAWEAKVEACKKGDKSQCAPQ